MSFQLGSNERLGAADTSIVEQRRNTMNNAVAALVGATLRYEDYTQTTGQPGLDAPHIQVDMAAGHLATNTEEPVTVQTQQDQYGLAA